MAERVSGNKALRDALAAFRKRGKYPSDRQAILVIMDQAEYRRADQFYEFLSDKRRPDADNRVRLAKILKRPVDVLWPPRSKEVVK